MATAKVDTAWGPASVVEELAVPQKAGDRKFSAIVQLLEGAKGEQLVRFAYTTDGRVRRGPVTLRKQDLKRFRAELAARPGLAAALGLEDA